MKKTGIILFDMQNEALQNSNAASEWVRDAHRKIAENDHAGPGYNAVLEWNPDAEAIAAGLDRERLLTGTRSPLHGIPILLKDNIGTDDALHTSAGALALAERYAPYESHVAGMLRKAGAVICGKTNMTELANFMTEGMPNGFSSRGGQVRHAIKAGEDPSGSSTGSAVAVAAGYVTLAVGTETCGSIISPAVHAGIAAIKPTVGWISRSGIIPISPSQDTAGPMARSVRDCVVAFSLMAGFDPTDPATESCIGREIPGLIDCSRYEDGLTGVRIGVCRKDVEDEEAAEVSPIFLRALERLKDLGAELVDYVPPKLNLDDMLTVLVHEFKPAMGAALKDDTGSIRTLAELASYNTQHAETCLMFGQTLVEKAIAIRRPMLTSDYIEARKRILETRSIIAYGLAGDAEDIDVDNTKDRVDAVISPKGLFAFPVVGAPAITFPIGFDDEKGLPVSVVLNGAPFSEARLFGIAAALEDAHAKFKRFAVME